MTDLSVIILTKNEKLHIKRCLEKLAPLEARQIFVVDCFSTDGSDKTASEMGATASVGTSRHSLTLGVFARALAAASRLGLRPRPT